ncbi:acid ceramidase-like isoform X2 [Xenia sp. Carnegie-2017]|uniref:acid ceramidase-like isoform X2 n=1 Tax=Xenia sp. Carnegie-2017 TaxID=2897299 RepID=UPI001F0489FB|nr:acid ceramidase-like isoform X2 [Xenia sp. Carnegie-2017]
MRHHARSNRFFTIVTIVREETKCNTDAYPPPLKDQISDVYINLDLKPEDRWKEISLNMKVELLALLHEIKNFTNFILNGKLFNYIDKDLPFIADTLPDPYGNEIKGIAKATGIPLGEIVLYNIFYEVFTVCTSIVAQTPGGKLFHARNLDFGLLLGWDVANNTWSLPEVLRPLIRNFYFQRSGKTAYVVTGFTGFVGAISGMKPGVLSLTMNERFNVDGGFVGILEWIIGFRGAKWTTFLARDVLESSISFEMAYNALSNKKILAPCYYILGGNSTGQGAVITRDRTRSIHPMRMEQTEAGWYVLQTNYDHWKAPLIIDDRRTPGKKCMNEMTQKKVGFNGLYNVLSTIPVLNKLTSYTVLMQVNTGKVESYRRYCNDPCFPW